MANFLNPLSPPPDPLYTEGQNHYNPACGVPHSRQTRAVSGEEDIMPDGILSKTQAEVALDLVSRYLEFTGEEERAKYRDADAYLGLYERAYRLILETSEREGKSPTGFKL
jgi:hypothetical protein